MSLNYINLKQGDVMPTCKRCGKCCTYEIPITLLDIHKLSSKLAKPSKYIFETVIQSASSEHSGLYKIKKDDNNTCIFFSPTIGCTIYDSRPSACEIFFCEQTKTDSSSTQVGWC